MKQFLYLIVVCVTIMSCGRTNNESGSFEIRVTGGSDNDYSFGDKMQLTWLKSRLDTMEISDDCSIEHQRTVLQLKYDINLMEGSCVEALDFLSQILELDKEYRRLQALRARKAWVTGNRELSLVISDSVITRCNQEIDSLGRSPDSHDKMQLLGNVIYDLILEYALTDREMEGRNACNEYQSDLVKCWGDFANSPGFYSTLIASKQKFWNNIEQCVQGKIANNSKR